MRNHLFAFLFLTGYLLGTPPLYAQLIARNQPARPQSVPQTDPTYRAASLPLRDALMQLKKQHGVDILFEENLLDGLTVRASLLTTNANTNLETSLSILLKPTNLRYRRIRKDAYMILSAKPEARVGFQTAPVLSEPIGRSEAGVVGSVLRPVLAFNLPVDQSVTGKVLAENGEALPGVTIVVKGTSRGTTTDANGTYKLSVPDLNAILIFSFVGYEPMEQALNGQSILDAILRPDVKSLSEVVVVGYGTVQRKDLTGAVSSINNEEVKDLALTRVDQALLGRVAGVQVKPVSGEPGAAPQILIRGIGSISAGTGPLFVVDGYPTGNIETLNPNDIESLDILKDASATAIYGSRGANGVVIINTKRGKSGKTRFGFNTYAGWQKVSKLPVMMNARETAQYYYDGVRNRNLDEGNPLTGPANLWRRAVPVTILDVLEGRNTYDGEALNEVLRTAPQQQYQLTASGGTDKLKFALSSEYFNQDGIVINSSFKRYSFRANIDAQLSNRLSIKVNLNPSYTDKYDVSAAGSAGTSSSETIMGSAMVINNYYPLYNPDGSYFAFSNLDAQGNFQNPVAIAREILDREKRMRLLGNINLEYKLFDDLKLNVLLGANLFTAKGVRFKPKTRFSSTIRPLVRMMPP